MRWSSDDVRRQEILDLVHRHANLLEHNDCASYVQRSRHKRRRGLQPVAPAHVGGEWAVSAVELSLSRAEGRAVSCKSTKIPTANFTFQLSLITGHPYGTAFMLATPDRRRQLLLLPIVFGESQSIPCFCSGYFLISLFIS
jgi:hypothetical protein